MRLLSLSNFYPPASRGGYEQWCQEVSEGLVERGHEVIVLTSCYNREQVNGAGPRWVHRELHLEMDLVSLRNAVQFFTQRRHRVQKNLALLRRLIADWKPDVVLVWGMW